MFKLKSLFICFVTLFLFSFSFFLFSMSSFSYAQGNWDVGESDFAIIPESEKDWSNVINDIAQWGSVWDKYNDKANSEEMSLADQIATGVMTWDTLLDYIVYLARFLWQLGLLIAAMVIIYIWYEKAMKVFHFWDTKISNVILGILVIAFAYAIIKLFYSFFLS